MLPVEFVPARKGEGNLDKFHSVFDKTARNFNPKRKAMSERVGFSFMIEDILGDNRDRRKPLNVPKTTPPPPTTCPSTSYEEDSMPSSVSNLNHETHSYEFGEGSNRLFVPTTSVFLPSPSPTRFGYYSPTIAASPPFSFPSRNPDMFTFFPSDLNEHLNCNYMNMRQDSLMRSHLYSPSVILDLSNYVSKSSSACPSSSAVSMPNSNTDCSGNRQIIWKHIPRNPAKRKGGQIRFTSDQTTTLENTFAEHKYLSSTERKRIAAALRLSERQVKTWFQNRRAKWRRIKQEPTCQVSSSESEDSHQVKEPRTGERRFSGSEDSHIHH